MTHESQTWAEILPAIFARQEELMAKYKEMEKLPDPPLSLHTMHGQRILKDFAWRTIEEMSEAFEQLVSGEKEGYHGEEMADALHFIVELMIFAGISPAQCLAVLPVFPPTTVNDSWQTDKKLFWDATYSLGLAMHHLKNKPWKKTQVPTDEGAFRQHVLIAFKAHIDLWAGTGFTLQHLFNFYFKKSAVNQQRQQGNY